MHLLRRLRHRSIPYGRTVLRHGQPPGQTGAYVRSPRTGATAAQPQRPERGHAPQPALFHPAFREAAAIRDTYAMSVSIIPILSRYSIYTEKKDTLRYYLQALRDLTPGTPEEGADAYAEMCIGFYRLGHQYDLAENLRLAHEVYDWSNTPPEEPRTSTSAPNACFCAAMPTSRSATTRAETGGPTSRRPTRGAKPTN